MEPRNYIVTGMTLASFAAGKNVATGVSFVLQGDNSGWATIASDEYYLDRANGRVLQRPFNDSGTATDWSAYTSFRATYALYDPTTYATTTYTNETQTYDVMDWTPAPYDVVTGRLSAGLVAGLVVNAQQFADTIASDNFSSGSAGWQITRAGDAEFNSLAIRLGLTSSYIALGNPPPTSATTGTGIWIDRAGIFGLASDVQQFYLRSSDGKAVAGAGAVTLDSTGLTLTEGNDVVNRVSWAGGSYIQAYPSIGLDAKHRLTIYNTEVNTGIAQTELISATVDELFIPQGVMFAAIIHRGYESGYLAFTRSDGDWDIGGLLIGGTDNTIIPDATIHMKSTAPSILFEDTTGAAKSLKLEADANTLSFYEYGNGNPILSLALDKHNAIIGNAALATNATDGFLYISTSAGVPSGTPSTYTGRSPIHVDTTNHNLYFYDSAWRKAVTSTDLDVDTFATGFVIDYTGAQQTTIAFDGTNTFTLAPTATTWSYYRNGTKYTITGSKTATLSGSPPASKGLYYIYLNDGTGTLTVSTSAWTLDDGKIPVATIAWDNALTPKYWMSDERHSCAIPRRFHWEHHLTDGTEVSTFPSISGYSVAPSSPADTDNTFGLSAGVIIDEDIKHTLSALTDPNGTSTDYVVMYRNGASTWNWEACAMPYRYTAAGYIQYDSSGTMTQGQNGKYYTSYVLLTILEGAARFVCINGQAEYSTLEAAQGELFTGLTKTGLPISEYIAAYKLVWYANASYGTKGKCRLAVTPQSINVSVSGISATPTTVWGSILGTLSNQTDLQAALDAKQVVNHTHAGTTNSPKLSQANTHESPDTDSGTSSLHHTIGTGANQAAAGNHTHSIAHTSLTGVDTDASTSAIHHTLGTGANQAAAGNHTHSSSGSSFMLFGIVSSVVASGATVYIGPGGYQTNGNDNYMQVPVPVACTISKLEVRFAGAQDASGSLVLTVRKNGVGTALTVTLSAGDAGGVWKADSTNSVSFAAGDYFSIHVKNNATASSSAIRGWSVLCTA